MPWIGVILLVAAISVVFAVIVAGVFLVVGGYVLDFSLRGRDSVKATRRDNESVAGTHGRRHLVVTLLPPKVWTWRDPDPYRTIVEKATALDAHHGAEAHEKGFRARQRRKAHEVDTHIRYIKNRE